MYGTCIMNPSQAPAASQLSMWSTTSRARAGEAGRGAPGTIAPPQFAQRHAAAARQVGDLAVVALHAGHVQVGQHLVLRELRQIDVEMV